MYDRKTIEQIRRDMDKSMAAHRREVDERMKEMQKEVDMMMSRANKKAKEIRDAENRRMYKEHNDAQEWKIRRVLFSKTCAETGETIKPLQPAYFKDWWDKDGQKTREWISEQAYTWKVLKDDV